MTSFPREDNRVPVVGGVSKVDMATPTTIATNPTTHAMVTEGSFSVSATTLNSGNNTLTVLYADINVSGNGDNTVISGVALKKITVLNGLIIASAAVTVKFTDGAVGASVAGIMALQANGGFVIPYAPTGNFQTSAGNDLVLNLSGAIQVGGWLSYVTI